MYSSSIIGDLVGIRIILVKAMSGNRRCCVVYIMTRLGHNCHGSMVAPSNTIPLASRSALERVPTTESPTVNILHAEHTAIISAACITEPGLHGVSARRRGSARL